MEANKNPSPQLSTSYVQSPYTQSFLTALKVADVIRC